jgi:hypothetical protein
LGYLAVGLIALSSTAWGECKVGTTSHALLFPSAHRSKTQP